MAEQVTQNNGEKFSEEEYYQFSRCRYWTISEFLKLVFNDKSLKYPNEASEEFGYLNLIFDGIYEESFESFKWGDPHPKTLRPIENPHYNLPTQERYLVTTQVSAKQAFSFAHNLHLALAMEIPKDDPLYLVFNADRAIKLPEEFLKMEEEIDPSSSYLETLKISPAWTIRDLIRIIFGERYKEYKKIDNEIVDNFINLVKANIHSKKIIPIHSSQEEKEFDIFFKPIDLVEFILSETVFGWLMKNGFDVLEWVEDLFDHFKEEEKNKVNEDNTETSSMGGKQITKNKNFFPAPDGTTWNQVVFIITIKKQVKIKINNDEKLFKFEDLKKIIRKGKSFRLLFGICTAGPSFNKDSFNETGAKEHLRQYVSDLRVNLKELFNIDSDPFTSMGKGEYKTNFGTVTPFYEPSSKQYQVDLEEQASPEDKFFSDRIEKDDTSHEEDQPDSWGDKPLDF
jgi:hypothetical protein